MSLFKIMQFPLRTTKEDIDFLFEMVRKSPYVNNNIDYKKKAQNTTIKFEEENEQVNAHAGSESVNSHYIRILQGICNATRLTSVALAQFKNDSNIERLKNTCKWIGNKIINSQYIFSTDALSDGLEELEYSTDDMIAIDAKSYAAGSIIATIAHEQGHICLSHTVRGPVDDDVSRNDERQAELFSCSVSTATPFAGHIVLASLFVNVLFAWMMGDDEIATTHPHSRERVFNTVNSHERILKNLGITKNNIEDFLP
jgi:hypothetical protein